MTTLSRTVTRTATMTARVTAEITRQGVGMDTGYITRQDLATPLADLNLFSIDAAYGLPIYDFAESGLDPGAAPMRRQAVAAQWVPGAGQVGASPGMATATYSFVVTAVDGATLDTRIGALVTAVYNQEEWELHVSFGGSRAWGWTNWKSDEPQIGMSAAFWGPGPEPAMWTPVTVTTLRHPTLLAGPYQAV